MSENPIGRTRMQPGFLARAISRIYPEDPQAVVTLAATAVLLAVAVAIAAGIVRQLWMLHDVTWGSVGALVVALGAPCVLAHVKAPSLPIGAAALIAPGAPEGCGATPDHGNTESADRSMNP